MQESSQFPDHNLGAENFENQSEHGLIIWYRRPHTKVSWFGLNRNGQEQNVHTRPLMDIFERSDKLFRLAAHHREFDPSENYWFARPQSIVNIQQEEKVHNMLTTEANRYRVNFAPSQAIAERFRDEYGLSGNFFYLHMVKYNGDQISGFFGASTSNPSLPVLRVERAVRLAYVDSNLTTATLSSLTAELQTFINQEESLLISA